MRWSQALGPQGSKEIPRANHQTGILITLRVALPSSVVGLPAAFTELSGAPPTLVGEPGHRHALGGDKEAIACE